VLVYAVVSFTLSVNSNALAAPIAINPSRLPRLGIAIIDGRCHETLALLMSAAPSTCVLTRSDQPCGQALSFLPSSQTSAPNLCGTISMAPQAVRAFVSSTCAGVCGLNDTEIELPTLLLVLLVPLWNVVLFP
jgi:hypothetical protein